MRFLNEHPRSRRRGAAARTLLVAAGFTVGIVFLILWLAGTFKPKLRPAAATPAHAGRTFGADEELVAVRVVRLSAQESAVGTVRAVRETTVAAKLLAKVAEVRVRAGQRVAKDEWLVRLDDEDLKARQERADAASREAEAVRTQAQTEFDRVSRLFAASNAAKAEFDQADAALKAAAARLEQAQQAQREAGVQLGYATIVSPMDGLVVDKRVEAGDMVSPGQALLSLYDPTHMQLVASVRESLVPRLSVGQVVSVRIEALGRTCAGEVSEIVPESDVASRSFAVKVTGPCPPDIHSGMFGRLLIPLDEEEWLVIPQAAVRRVGQLDSVAVAAADGKTLHRRVVQLGRTLDADVEVLSGLRAGERVAVDESVTTRRTGE
jgi:RND family efflux transporter MFP subunit